ncbi:MAG: hypothetical protein COB15_11895 [Flavobacteriales bacterium]|nr:MAG: hypothetical protein COB15_11895 [Flavobacteriales bacterium]
MKTIKLFILFYFLAIEVFSQNDKGVKMMITLSGKDTLVIKKFDENQNLIFHKIFPQYGVSQLLTWEYSNNKIISYTWTHSSRGIIEQEYEYDSLNNLVNIYSYKLDERIPIKNLMSYHSIYQLKRSKEFQNYLKNGKRFLETTQYFDADLKTKELIYSSDSRTDTVLYTYSNHLRTNKKHIYGHNGAFNEIIYRFDNEGKELGWTKFFSPADTAYVYTNLYQNNLLTRVTSKDRGKLSSIEKYEYSEGKLKSVQQFNGKDELKISTNYVYDEYGKILYTDEMNKYMGQLKRTHYYY